MQLSLAQCAADDFVSFTNEPQILLEQLLDRSLTESEHERLPLVVSDLLHIWLVSGLAHKACHDDVLVYINAVALVYVEFSMRSMLSGEGYKPVPPTPQALLTPVTEDSAAFVTKQEFLLPVSLLPDGFVQTARLSIENRRSEVREFIAHPERHRYGFNTYQYNLGV
ncbi:MAG TPA: hypothetical protein VL294_11455 [Pseudolysinimonas sp.]|jgi:hypothetical protein|nr:hypothetical protein [Pseudolysinimonas sp.]